MAGGGIRPDDARPCLSYLTHSVKLYLVWKHSRGSVKSHVIMIYSLAFSNRDVQFF